MGRPHTLIYPAGVVGGLCGQAYNKEVSEEGLGL